MATIDYFDERNIIKDVEELRKVLKNHDWEWFWSDDNRCYRRGKGEENKIRTSLFFLAQQDASMARSLVDEFVRGEHRKPLEEIIRGDVRWMDNKGPSAGVGIGQGLS